MVEWHHRLNWHEFQQAVGDSEGQGRLACCGPWGHQESDTTEKQNNNPNYKIGYLLSFDICFLKNIDQSKRVDQTLLWTSMREFLRYPWMLSQLNSPTVSKIKRDPMMKIHTILHFKHHEWVLALFLLWATIAHFHTSKPSFIFLHLLFGHKVINELYAWQMMDA